MERTNIFDLQLEYMNNNNNNSYIRLKEEKYDDISDWGTDR